MGKEQDLQYIKGFSKISVKNVCEELGVDRVNVITGRASAKNIEAVKNKIKEKLEELE